MPNASARLSGLPETIVFLDVEASGLGEDTYPIEVGWAFLNGGSGGMLIRPAIGWTLETWDPFAEEVHGISWDMLLRQGLPARDVADSLNRLRNRADLILSDAPQQDSYWLSRLFDETPEQQAFSLSDERAARRRFLGGASSVLEEGGLRAEPAHRAELDAQGLAAIWQKLMNEESG